MSAERELRLRRRLVKYQESDNAAEPKRAARRGETDRCYKTSHRPQLPMSTERELRPRRAPVKYHESDDGDDDDDDPEWTTHDDDDDDDDDDPEWATHRAVQRPRRGETDRHRRYRESHRPQRAEYQKRYRARRREHILETNKRYREQHRQRIREKNRRYFNANKERVLAQQKQYRESRREELRKKQRRYRESRREVLREKQRRYRESRREVLREQNRIRKARFRAKKRMEKLMTLTIPLTDCQKSMPVTEYVQTFCDSLDSVDTPPPESFLNSLRRSVLRDLIRGPCKSANPLTVTIFHFCRIYCHPTVLRHLIRGPCKSPLTVTIFHFCRIYCHPTSGSRSWTMCRILMWRPSLMIVWRTCRHPTRASI